MVVQSIVNQISQRIVRGTAPSTPDYLLYSPISIVRIGLNADTVAGYIQNTDYKISGSLIIWLLTSANQPTPGQAYYITYNYNPPQFLKDFNTVQQELSTDFNTLLPNLDITKSAARDLYVNVPGRQFSDEYNAIRHVFLIQTLQNVDELSVEELDAIGVNYSRPRQPGAKSTGTELFGLFTARLTSVIIPSGYHMGTQPALTNGQQITFVTTASATIPPGSLSVQVPIEAQAAGSSGQVGADSIKIPIDSIDIDYITNPVATGGGNDQETNVDYAKRLMSVFKSRNVGTQIGLLEVVLAQANVIDAYIADVGDPIMLRDGGLGGKVDVYVQAESGFAGSITDEDFTYTGIDYTFLHQPAISITTVKVNNALVSPTTYQLIKDVGLYADSTRATDKLHFLSGVSPSDDVKVSYVYNALFNDVQDLLDSDLYHIAGIDVLVRGAIESLIDVTGTIKIQIGYVFTDVRDIISNQIIAYIDNKNIGAQIVYGDVLNIIHDTPGVADLLPLSRLSRRTEGTASTIQLRGNEFPFHGNILIRQMT
jgi:uncharacterized phage protein gp47/JayE